MKKLLLATVFSIACVTSANAALIATFGQTETGNTVTAVSNGTSTTITVANSTAGITTFAGGPIGTAFFNLSALSNDPVVTLGGALIQHYDGNFCFTSLANCGGTNYLSGVFSDAAFGAIGGPGLVVNVNSPPDTLILTSSVLLPSDLVPPSSFNLGFTNLTPLLSVDGTTIASFTASYAGNVSASSTAVPEPASLLMLGMGLLGVAAMKRKLY